MTHTKGPWNYDEVWALIKGPEGEEICAVHSALRADSNRRKPEIATANARLIAAAPELLQACEAALSYLQDPESSITKGEKAIELLTYAIKAAKC